MPYFGLRDAVLAQATSRTIALDLSEVKAIGGGGLGMLAFCNAGRMNGRSILKLFSPSSSVMTRAPAHPPVLLNVEVATLQWSMSFLAEAGETVHDGSVTIIHLKPRQWFGCCV